MRYVGIDPSSKTGFVAMDAQGNVLVEKEIAPDKKGVELLDELVSWMELEIQEKDIVCIEGFSHGSKGSAVDMQYGIGWTIRLFLHWSKVKNVIYTDVAPGQVKKFATGNHMAKKENMILPIFKKWKYEHDSDNVRDAYVLAQIARHLHESGMNPTQYQQEVLDALRGIKTKKARKKP